LNKIAFFICFFEIKKLPKSSPEIILHPTLFSPLLVFDVGLLHFCLRDKQFVIASCPKQQTEMRGIVKGLVVHWISDATGSIISATDVKDLVQKIKKARKPLSFKFCHPQNAPHSKLWTPRRSSMKSKTENKPK